MTLVAAAGIGILLGIATQLLQGILPGALNWIANALSGWLLAAFLLGSRMPTPRIAAAASVVMLVAALAGYYATVQVRFGYGPNGSILLFWGLGSVVGGLVFGSAGWWWRHWRPRARAAAAGLLAALFIAEGIYFLVILPDSTVGLGAIIAGLTVPAVLGRDGRERGWGYLAMLPGLALGAVGYGVTLVVYGVLTGGRPRGSAWGGAGRVSRVAGGCPVSRVAGGAGTPSLQHRAQGPVSSPAVLVRADPAPCDAPAPR